MKFRNFLENLYLGRLDTEVFRSLSDSKTDDQTIELIERFHDISQQFPPSDLEKTGKVPKELLAELKARIVNCSARPRPGIPSTMLFS
jgi:hypothetical protein